MVKKKILYLIGFLFVISLLISIGQVKAHNPSNMTLEYDLSNETLSVTISHTSGNYNTHYIFEVDAAVNGCQKLNENYTSQPSNRFTYNYNLTASGGDVIEVYAFCTEGGIFIRSITVEQPAESIPGNIGIWLLIGAFAIIFLVAIKKRSR